MIDPVENHSAIVTSLDQFGSFVAKQDLTLRQLIVTVWDGHGVGGFFCEYVLSSDPDLAPLLISGSEETFQLQLKFRLEKDQISRGSLRNLSFPILKDQSLYWNSSNDAVLTQLIFS